MLNRLSVGYIFTTIPALLSRPHSRGCFRHQVSLKAPDSPLKEGRTSCLLVPEAPKEREVGCSMAATVESYDKDGLLISLSKLNCHYK